MLPRLAAPVPLPSARVKAPRLLLALVLVLPATVRAQEDPIDITGQQNLTLGSGARAYGMGGAFLARADDATAASWNPAGLSYLRAPELSLVGAHNSFDTVRNLDGDSFHGSTVDFAAFTWPVGAGEVRGAVQLSYQRAISFDGTRRVEEYGVLNDATTPQIVRTDDGKSNGGFDVIAFGTGLRLSRRVRAGLTINRWFNGYQQDTVRNNYLPSTDRQRRDFTLDMRPHGWSFNLGLIVSPIEELNVAAVFKTPFTARTSLDKSRRDYFGSPDQPSEVTTNSYASDEVRIDFPYSLGFGLSWRARERLTLSADYTRSAWSSARIRGFFQLLVTPPTDSAGNPGEPPAPKFLDEQQYPTLQPVPDPQDPTNLAALRAQQDGEQIRAGVEWVAFAGRFKIPLRGGYFNDRQITPTPGGEPVRFNGLTVGTGLIVGPMQLDLAYVYEFGEYFVATESGLDQPAVTSVPIRYALTTNRVYASIIYRFSGRWLP
jgi:long-subunit fatty acid transport protein